MIFIEKGFATAGGIRYEIAPMRVLATILALVTPVVVYAQNAPGARPTPRPDMRQGAEAFAIRPPDEGSPFFEERNAAQVALASVGTDNNKESGVAIYPKVKDSPDSATAMFTRFFTTMFSSVKWRTVHTEKTTEKLQLQPAHFELSKQKELDATYTVKNNTGKLMRLDFTTTQRIDLVTTDASGKVVDRWSDDRTTQPQDGIIIINPKERIQYDEKVPTRDMKPAQSYTIQSQVVGYPDYTVSKTVVPSP